MWDHLEQALTSIPSGLRTPLLNEFRATHLAFSSQDWEKVGLKAGKICEIVYSIVDGATSGSFPPAPTKPANMLRACADLERLPGNFPRSLRIQIPRILIALYELRNNRSIGHVGGDVEPSHMDAEFFLRGCQWLIGELVRHFHGLPEAEAHGLVEAVSARNSPLIWRDGEIRRVLKNGLSTADQVLVLLHTEVTAPTAAQLADWIEYKNKSRFRSKILRDMQAARLIEHNKSTDVIKILPPGTEKAEQLFKAL